MKNDSDFVEFQRYFKEYQTKFGMNGYRVYFKCEPINDGFADITIDQGRMVATVRLNSRTSAKDKISRSVKHSAKHEALHLLVGRLEENGCFRYISKGEIDESCEELVFRLENLIPDIE